MVVIVGESGGGKSSVAKMLADKYGYKNVVTYTTRPMRTGEIDGVDYHFVDERQLNKMQDSLGLETNYRGWHYATDINDLTDDSVVVVTPSGLRELKRKGFIFKSIYLNVPRRDRLIQLLNRGDDIEEAYRRSLSDVGQFDGVEDEVDFVINNSKYKKSVENIVQEILQKIGSAEICRK